MKNVIFIISTLQECDVFFSFAAGLKDKNKRLKITTFIDDPICFEQLKKNKSLFYGYKKIGSLIGRIRKKKIFQKFYNFFWILKSVLILTKIKSPVLLSSDFQNIYRITFQLFSKKKGQSIILMPHSLLWHYQYKEFKKRVSNYKFFKKNPWQKIFNLKPSGYIYYNKKQFAYAKILKKGYEFETKQMCCSGLGSETNFYINFFDKEYKKYQTKLSFLKKNDRRKKIFSIICASHGPFLLKQDSQQRILKEILTEIIKCDKNSIILIRMHPKDNNKNSSILKIIEELKIKKNIIITNLHPQILARFSNRIIFYARTNVMTDIFRTKMIDCSEYKKEDLYKNNQKSPGNFGYGVIYLNPRKKNFKERFRKILVNDNFFLNKKIYKEEKEFIKNNKFNYQKVEDFFKTNIL